MHLIGLDVGTTGCKAVVFDLHGAILGRGFREYDVLCSEPAMAEQNAEHVWTLTHETLCEAVQRAAVKDIAALSVSVQGDAIIPVDHEFRALHHALLGMDYRSQPQARRCAELFGAFELFQRTGMRSHPINSLNKVLYLRDTQPRVFDRAWKIVTYADFILGKLGAEPIIDHSMASRTMAFDLAEHCWSPAILNRLELRESLFSRAVPSGTPVGTIRRDLAHEFGVPETLQLVAGAHDQPCAALGSGMVRERLGVVSTGTAEVLATAFVAPVLTRQMFDGFYPCYLHAVPGLYFTFALNHVGGILLKWYRDQFCATDVAEAQQRAVSPYHLLDTHMPEGPSPVLVLPHFNGSGTPWCDLDSKGAIVGLTMATTRHDIAKAILEGLCFELLINLNTMQETGIDIPELVAAGGGAKSALWLQLKADILGRPIRTLRCQEAACLGAALLAGTAVGAYRSLEEAVAQTVAPDREYTPRPDLTARYSEKFEVYRRLYPTLRPLHAQL